MEKEKDPAIEGGGSSAAPLSTSPLSTSAAPLSTSAAPLSTDPAPDADWRPSKLVGPDLGEYYKSTFEPDYLGDEPLYSTTSTVTLPIPPPTTTDDGIPLPTTSIRLPTPSTHHVPPLSTSEDPTTDAYLQSEEYAIRYKEKGKAKIDDVAESEESNWDDEVYLDFGRMYHKIEFEKPDIDWKTLDVMLGTVFKNLGVEGASVLRSSFEIVLPGIKRYGSESIAELCRESTPDPLSSDPARIGYLYRSYASLGLDTRNLDEMIALELNLPLAQVTPLRMFYQLVDYVFGKVGGFEALERLYEGYESYEPTNDFKENSDETLVGTKVIPKGGKHWQDKEDNFLKQKIENGEIKISDSFLEEVEAICGNKRTKKSCQARITRLKLKVVKKVPRWTQEEDKVLLAKFKEAKATNNYDDLLKALKAIEGNDRTVKGCQMRWKKLKAKDNGENAENELDGENEEKAKDETDGDDEDR